MEEERERERAGERNMENGLFGVLDGSFHLAAEDLNSGYTRMPLWVFFWGIKGIVIKLKGYFANSGLVVSKGIWGIYWWKKLSKPRINLRWSLKKAHTWIL